MVPMLYQHSANARFDGVNLLPNVAQMHNSQFYSLYPVRAPDQVVLRPFSQSAMLCSFAPTIPDTQIHNHIPNSTQDYGHVMQQQSYQHQLPFPHVAQNAQSQSSTPTSMQRPILISAASVSQAKHTKPREKCPLTVVHPVTRATVDLGSTSDELPVEKSAGSPEAETQIAVISATSVSLHDSEVLPSDPINPVAPSLTSDCSVIASDLESANELIAPPVLLDKKPPSVEHLLDDLTCDPSTDPTRLEVESPDDRSCLDGHESDGDDVPFRRRYPRDFLLSLKFSPTAKISLVNLEVITNITSQYKYRRNAHRAPQRIIRLPTGMTVKTVEGAFVPTSLRSKDEPAESDKSKVLSRELNVILNRVSDGNLSETVADIKKLGISSSDDLQLLAKLVFQKGIRQPKYSKVFATLCKDLKGFEVSGSEAFEHLVLNQVHDLFNTPLDTLISDLNDAINEKIKSAKDDAVKRILDEDRETSVLKKKEAYDGNMTLFAELFLCRLVPLKSMTDCLKKLKESAAPEALRSILIILRICGSELDVQAKSVMDTCFNRLIGHIKSNKLPTHQVFKIQELCDLRDRGWKELNHGQDLPVQPVVASRRLTEDKIRWPQPALDPKRRSVQSVNPVTPSSLAVTQQHQDPQKLKPTKFNWNQGSGLLKSVDDSQSQNTKTVSHPTPGYSREPSPIVLSGPQGAWAKRTTSGPTNAHENLKPAESYESVLNKCQEMARTTIALLVNREDAITTFEECPVEHRSALLHLVLDLLMEKSLKERNAAGELCVRLLDKKLLSPVDMASACRTYFSTLDDGFLEDYPLGWMYLAEIFQHFIQDGPDHFQLLTSILKPLDSGGRGATVLAHCLRMSAARLGANVVSFKFQSMRLDWMQLGIQGDVLSFTKGHSVSFTIDRNPLVETLKELVELAQSKSTTLDQLNNLFKQVSQCSLPHGFIRHCTIALVTRQKDLPRQIIDQRVIALGILVDHNPERESQVLLALEECSKTVSVEQWRKSLLDNTVISSEAFRSLMHSNHCKGPIGKNFPMPE